MLMYMKDELFCEIVKWNEVLQKFIPFHYLTNCICWVPQGWRSRSGRPGDGRTNVLTVMGSLTLCLQARNRCPHKLHGPNVKKRVVETSEQADSSMVASHSWPVLLGIGPSSERLACAAPSHGSPGVP